MPNALKTAVLLGAMSALLLFLGQAIGGPQGLIVGFLFAVVTNFGSYWFSADIVLRTAHAKEIKREQDPALFDMIADVARASSMPMPRV